MLIQQTFLDGPAASADFFPQPCGRQLQVKGFRTKFSDPAPDILFIFLQQPEAPETPGVKKPEFGSVIQMKDQVGMFFCGKFRRCCQELAGHSQMEQNGIPVVQMQGEIFSPSAHAYNHGSDHCMRKNILSRMSNDFRTVHRQIRDSAFFQLWFQNTSDGFYFRQFGHVRPSFVADCLICSW